MTPLSLVAYAVLAALVVAYVCSVELALRRLDRRQAELVEELAALREWVGNVRLRFLAAVEREGRGT